MKKKNLNAEEIVSIENKTEKSIINEIVANKILTPQRVEELFFQAIGDVLSELNEDKKGE